MQLIILTLLEFYLSRYTLLIVFAPGVATFFRYIPYSIANIKCCHFKI